MKCCVISLKETLQRLMLRDPLFPRDHRLAGYHYSGANPSERAASSLFCLFFCSHILYSLLFFHVRKSALFNFLPGCDCWTAEEKRYFNKGISAYRKDFFMVQKLVRMLICVSLLTAENDRIILLVAFDTDELFLQEWLDFSLSASALK